MIVNRAIAAPRRRRRAHRAAFTLVEVLATLAESKLSEMVAQGDWSFGAGSGDFGTDWPGYQWTCTTANPDPNVNVTEVTVTVTWTERGQQRDVSVATFVYAGSANGAGTTGGL